MKDKVVFFILGTVLATFAYVAGNVSQVKAKDEMTVDRLIVKEKLILEGDAKIHGTLDVVKRIQVGNGLNEPYVIISVEPEGASILAAHRAYIDRRDSHTIRIFTGDRSKVGSRTYSGILIRDGEDKELLLRPK